MEYEIRYTLYAICNIGKYCYRKIESAKGDNQNVRICNEERLTAEIERLLWSAKRGIGNGERLTRTVVIEYSKTGQLNITISLVLSVATSDAKEEVGRVCRVGNRYVRYVM